MLHACHASSLWNIWFVVAHLRRGKPGMDHKLKTSMTRSMVRPPLCEDFVSCWRFWHYHRSFTWEGGNPRRCNIWPPRWRSATLLTGDFDLTTDRSFEKGETRRRFTSGPLDDDQLLCLLAILILFIGRVLRRRKLVTDPELTLLMLTWFMHTSFTQPLRGV